MANEQQLEILCQGAEAWNTWLMENPEAQTALDFSFADLTGLNLAWAYLAGADFEGATLSDADMSETDLSGANLQDAKMFRTNLTNANLTEANLKDAVIYESVLAGAVLDKATLDNANLNFSDLSSASLFMTKMPNAQLASVNLQGAFLMGAVLHKANLHDSVLVDANLQKSGLGGANLSGANLSGANLTDSNLERATLVETNLTGACLDNCCVYGISAWNLILDKTEQSNLVITQYGEPRITVDNLEVAQFMYMLLTNSKIRGVIDTVAKKGVLILGRFTPERKEVLDAIREKLRELNFVPIMFDFEGAQTRDFTETVKILGGMSRFIIADITMPKSSPLELGATVPDFMIPFVPIIWEGEEPFSMFSNLQNKYNWVLDVLEYKDAGQLVAVLEKAVIEPALKKEAELLPVKHEDTRVRHANDYL